MQLRQANWNTDKGRHCYLLSSLMSIIGVFVTADCSEMRGGGGSHEQEDDAAMPDGK